MPNQDDTWPQPSFNFKVIFPSLTNPVLFQQLSLPDGGSQGGEYRQEGNPRADLKAPETAKQVNAILHRGIFVNDSKFSEWYSKIGTGTTGRENVVIRLLDEKGNPTMWWTLINAWPVKITGADLKSDGNEAAVESLELAYESLVVGNS